MSCLDENTVLAFLDGRLTADARAATESHLAGCNACIDLVCLSDSRTVQGGTVAPERTLLDGAPQNRGAAGELTRGFVLAGRYEIQTTLGRGGMGVVVRAFDRVIGENVAIKVLRPEYAQDRRWAERLAREVRLARTIQHPNVCRIFDFGEADGHSFITMELATGGTLRDAIAAAAERSSAARIADATAVIRGLAAIHAAGIVHRDVTPQNILRMGDGRLVVSDFGLASVATGTTTSIHGGTIAYMAPEVLRGSPANFASDVWGLGLIIGEVLTGARPQNGDEQTAAPVSGASRTSVERKLMRISRSCLAVNPSRRPGTAGEVVEILEDRRRVPRRLWGTRSARAVTGVVAIVLAVVGAIAARKSEKTKVDAVQPALTIERDGEWLSKSRLVATFPGRIECLMALPDTRTIRVVIDHPRSASDVDIASGKVSAANLVPIAIAEGCARLSPDGKRLVYQGRDDKQRPHAMLSQKSDGSEAIPVIRIAEPSYLSEPRWLDDDTFVFDVDHEHAATLSLSTGKMVVIPGAPDEHGHRMGFLKAARDGEVLVAYSDSIGTRQNVRIFEWPSVRVTDRFPVDAVVRYWVLSGGTLFASANVDGSRVGLLRVKRKTGAALLREMPDRNIGPIVAVDSARLAFVAWITASEVWTRDDSGKERRVFVEGEPFGADRSMRGDLLVATAIENQSVILHYDATGTLRGPVTEGPEDGSPVFFPDGKHWLFTKVKDDPGIYKCALGEKVCERIMTHGSAEPAPATSRLAMSPNGQRIAYVALSSGGIHARWMPANGGPSRQLTDTETACTPVWATDDRIWISRRLGGRPVWVEFSVDFASETGRRHPGEQDCMTGGDDPAAPINPTAWIVDRRHSEVRITNMPDE